MTGEIDLNGHVHTIGGLDMKIDGGKWAGVKKLLVPEGNKQDLDIIKLKNPTILDNIEIVVVKTIWDVLEHSLVYGDGVNKIKFDKFNTHC
jgi:ATP-dependent Lon protease